MIDLSVVIVNWNGGQVLMDCLESVYTNSPQGSFELFVVDNASTDGSAQYAEQKYPQAQLIHSSTNLGFAAANNLAIEKAQGDFVLLLNPDTLVQPGALQILLDFLGSHPSAGAAGSMLLNADGTLQHSCSPEPTLAGEFYRLFHIGGVRPDGYYPMEEWAQTTPRQVDILLGACLMVHRNALLQIGFLDENFFIYSEEVDFCRRLRKAGWEIYWVPQAKVVHLGGQSTRQVASRMFLELYLAKVQYFRKHHGPFAALIYKMILFAAGLARLATVLLTWVRPSGRSEGQQALIHNYQQLIKALPGM